MCGIAGSIVLSGTAQPDAPQRMQRALAAMQHRGPDYTNTVAHNGCMLGHVRLSIIDTGTAAHQPMSDPEGRYILVFNGEVFNYLELRRQLPQVAFRTQSDTEVVLHYLIAHGIGGLHAFNGFFSLCFYDKQTGQALIARDRMGEKPLYYARQGDHLFFASELAPMLQFGIDRALDYSACTHYLMHGYYPPDRSALASVQKLERQGYLEIRQGQVHQGVWPVQPYDHSVQDPPTTFGRLLEAAVERRLISDVPLCTFLSGGIDSSLITALAHRHHNAIPAYTLRFDSSAYLDESGRASRLARELGLDHRMVSIADKDIPSLFDAMMQQMDEPFGDSSAIALYALTRAIGKPIKVALSGDGGDELLGGYRKHRAWLKAQQPGILNRLLTRLPVHRLPETWTGRENPWADALRKLKRYSGLLHCPKDKQYAYLRSFASDTEWLFDQPAMAAWHDDILPHTLNAFLQADQRWVLQGDMLVKTDRCGMWNSMEIRSPFMDPEVVAYCNALSEDWKIRQEHQKYVLHKFGETVLPAWMWEGTKKGFEIPLASALPELLRQFAPTRPVTDPYRATLHRALHHGHTTLHVRYHILVLMLWMDKHHLAG